MLLINIL